jgi:quercetin dioxygenase-like cupin family protein
VRGIEFAAASDLSTGYAAPTCAALGRARSSLMDFGGFPLWAVRAELEPGATLTWDDEHGDEGVYVLGGRLEVGDRVCPQGGAVIVEGQAGASASAPDGATLVHFGPRDPGPPSDGYFGPPAPEPHGVHVVGPGGMYAASEPGRDTRMFADSTCPTCRITLFVTGRDEPYGSARHSHTADEVQYVVRGEVHFGSRVLRPGDAVAIAGGYRYRFQGGPAGFAFLNYRRDASEQTNDGDIPRLEGGRARGLAFVNDVR